MRIPLFNTLYLSLLLFLFLLTDRLSFAKTLTIPGDANSIQEAVELAASGDEIVVATEEVKWDYKPDPLASFFLSPEGVVIKNKNLHIRGSETINHPSIKTGSYAPSSKSTMLWVENGYVTLNNLRIDAPALSYLFANGASGAPFHVESGSLYIRNCNFTCNIESKGNLIIEESGIKGYSLIHEHRGYFYTSTAPSILIGPAQNISIVFKDSTVTSDNDFSYMNVIFQNLNNCEVTFTNSHFIAGKYRAMQYSDSHFIGSDGVRIQDCRDTRFFLQKCSFRGGIGYRYTSGSGMGIHDSILTLQTNDGDNQLFGADGKDANIYTLPWELDKITQVPAVAGGHGLEIRNSKIQLINSSLDSMFTATGSKGGAGMEKLGISLPPAPGGLPIHIDQNSSIETVTQVVSWELY